MVQAPSASLLRVTRTNFDSIECCGHLPSQMADAYDDDIDADAGSDGKGRNKSRRELPAGAVATLKAWLLSPEHFTHPYPTPQDQAMLMQQTGIDKKQLKNWFTNARRRIWKPMLKKQIEQGKISATGGTGVTGLPGLMIPTIPGAALAAAGGTIDNPHSIQAIRVHYEQATQQQQQQSQQQQQPQQQQLQQQQTVQPQQSIGNAIYASTPAPVSTISASDQSTGQYLVTQTADTTNSQQPQISNNTTLGVMPQVASSSSSAQMSKTDSHAVLMELFARDQDLVRQATESARLKAESKQQPQAQQQQQLQNAGQPQSQGQAQVQQPSKQHPMRAPSSQNILHNVPTLNSWPQFSSINSLNNLGTMPGVKSTASMSGADLASKGNANKTGNLAQVKSVDSMGKNDSYAFLEVFFGDRSSSNLSAMGGVGSLKGGKSAGDEDNEIGLSLEDESPSHILKKETPESAPSAAAPLSSHMTAVAQESVDSGTLKRAYDDAMAARGLISVSRSSERLTDLVLPAKIQRTLSQEFINKEQQAQASSLNHFSYTSSAPPASSGQAAQISQQYPGQQPVEPEATDSVQSHTMDAIEVPSMDTQLRPCGHMFQDRCLKPSLQSPSIGPPKCSIDDVMIQSSTLSIPKDETPGQQQQQQQSAEQQPVQGPPELPTSMSSTWSFSTASLQLENQGTT